jgi:hypothetical protein
MMLREIWKEIYLRRMKNWLRRTLLLRISLKNNLNWGRQ